MFLFFFSSISFSIIFFRDYSSMQMFVRSLFVCFSLFTRLEMFILFFFISGITYDCKYGCLVFFFLHYFFSYIHDTFNALRLSVSCLYISFFLLLLLSKLRNDDLFFFYFLQTIKEKFVDENKVSKKMFLWLKRML